MSFDSREGLPRFGYDFDVDKWSDGDRDESGNLIWHHNYPDNDQWERVRVVTIDYDPQGEGDYRNYKIDPQKPLDPPGEWEPGIEDYYDIFDLAAQGIESDS